MVSTTQSTQNITIDGNEHSESNTHAIPAAAIRRKKYNSNWKQQTVPACRQELTFCHVVFFSLIVGVLSLVLGGVSYSYSSKYPKPVIVDYTDCTSVTGDGQCSSKFNYNKNETCMCRIEVNITEELGKSHKTILSYELTNFYQNVRDYKKFVDDNQLAGTIYPKVGGSVIDPKPCQVPYSKKDTSSNYKPVYPCGKISNSYFSDEFFMYNNQNQRIHFDIDNIAWESDKKKRFKEPELRNEKKLTDIFVFPQDWHDDIKSTFISKRGVTNPHFVVWMRTAAFSTFRKKYAVLKNLTQGLYTIEITYRFDVKSIRGKKKLVFSADNGGAPTNRFFVTALTITGVVCIFFWPAVHAVERLVLFLYSKRRNLENTSATADIAAVESEAGGIEGEILVSAEDKLVKQATPSVVMIKPTQSTASIRK